MTIVKSVGASQGMPGKIFVNYRRDDSAPCAARLRERLAAAFGQSNDFMAIMVGLISNLHRCPCCATVQSSSPPK